MQLHMVQVILVRVLSLKSFFESSAVEFQSVREWFLIPGDRTPNKIDTNMFLKVHDKLCQKLLLQVVYISSFGH